MRQQKGSKDPTTEKKKKKKRYLLKRYSPYSLRLGDTALTTSRGDDLPLHLFLTRLLVS